MNEQEAREWRECPLYRGFEVFRVRRNNNGEYEVLQESGAIITYKSEDFHRHFQKAAQRQKPILTADNKISHYEYVSY